MRHSLYANNSRHYPGEKTSLNKGYFTKPTQTKKGSLDDNILTLRVNALLEKCKEDPKKIENIKNKVDTFILNITVAREVRSKEQEKKLRKDFNNFLLKCEKENL